MSSAVGDFTGRTVIVTGGGAGIGAATCRLFADRGASVAVLDIDLAAAEAVAADCGGDAFAVGVDVADPDRIAEAVATLSTRWAGVDVLVNNAAVAQSSLLADSDDAHWDRVLQTNFLSAVRLTRAVVPLIRRRGGGSIVNICSLHARRGYPEWAAYASAKGALVSFTQQQAVEQAPFGIRVNLVSPGATMTPLNEQRIAAADDPAALRASMAAQSVFGRYGRPEEVAAVIAFVASDEASFVTGTDVVCDGGAAVMGP